MADQLHITDDPQLTKEIVKLLKDRDNLIVLVKPVDLFNIILAIQLATRHPLASVCWPIAIAKHAARELQQHFSPNLQTFLDKGWDPSQDLPTEQEKT